MSYDIPEGSLQESIFMDKYAYPGETKWKQLAKRVSKAVALPEKREVREQTEKKFFEAINSADFCPGGRYSEQGEISITCLIAMFLTLKIQ